VAHASAQPEQAVLFAGLAAFQLGWAVVVFRRPWPRLLLAPIAINLGTIAVWAGTRAAGAEGVGGLDLLATLDEAMLVALLLILRRGRVDPRDGERLAVLSFALVFLSLLAFLLLGHASR
jgi:hypothetical protein